MWEKSTQEGGAPGSCLKPGPVPAIMAIWGVSQQVEYCSLPVTVTFKQVIFLKHVNGGGRPLRIPRAMLMPL